METLHAESLAEVGKAAKFRLESFGMKFMLHVSWLPPPCTVLLEIQRDEGADLASDGSFSLSITATLGLCTLSPISDIHMKSPILSP
jgi:hypothetical protein